MKRGLSVLLNILISLCLFWSGVMLDASPSDFVSQMIQDQSDIIDQSQDPLDQRFRLDDTTDDTNHTGETETQDDTDAQQDMDVQDESEEQINSRYYYTLMDDSEKENYTRIQEAVEKEEKSVVLTAIDYEELDRIFTAVYNDYPEYFWCESSYSYRNNGEGMELIFDYNCTGPEREKREAKIKKQADVILSEIPADGKDYDKVKYVFETLVNMTEYNLDAPDNQNIYSVFGNWTTVCAGYAKATKYLLDRAGVECIYLVGIGDGESHAWNIVKCDGQYYYVDTTWGDPLYQEEQGEKVQKKEIAYEYLCCSEELLFRTHTPDSKFVLPKCTDHSLEYYRMKGCYLESADQQAILDIMKKDADGNKEMTEIQFSSKEAYDQAIAQIDSTLQQMREYIKSQKGKTLGEIFYRYMDSTYILIVYWE